MKKFLYRVDYDGTATTISKVKNEGQEDKLKTEYYASFSEAKRKAIQNVEIPAKSYKRALEQLRKLKKKELTVETEW